MFQRFYFHTTQFTNNKPQVTQLLVFTQLPSHVQIKDITYKNIWGYSSTKVAVKFDCSTKFPCKNVVLSDINLSHKGSHDVAVSECYHVSGASYGQQTPRSCIQSFMSKWFFFFFNLEERYIGFAISHYIQINLIVEENFIFITKKMNHFFKLEILIHLKDICSFYS